ncbi:HAMP domain-containing sensor histidine kinase [Catenulispora yoronensis]|uniref:histidine kinase n=1 Tax=Catenulispora yoronensis TaxID=450799 RepID=A0ABN2TL76_9ACTN
MRDQFLIILMGAGSAVGAAAIGWTALRMLRGRSLRASLFASAATAVLAVVAGALIASRAMFISSHDAGVVLVVSLSGALVTLVLAFLLSRSLADDSKALSSALQALGDGEPLTGRHGPADAAPALATGELAALSRELAATGAKLAESRDRERALERSRRELVAWVSHDLRTPLAGLRAMAEALEDGVAPDPARYYTQMREATDRLAGMVDDLFELSRIHAGALRLTLERVALADLVDGALAEGQPLAKARGIDLTGVVTTNATVHGDIRELSRALSNLVVNAIRHTPADGMVRIEASEVVAASPPSPRSTREPDAAGATSKAGMASATTTAGATTTSAPVPVPIAVTEPQVRISVTDACGGIPEEDLDRVFDVAWRGTPARTPEAAGPIGAGTGAGLGLAIVRGIAEAHSGDVTVGNVEGGCCFEMRLPVPVPVG